MEKVQWSGRAISVQPRIRLMRSFDQLSHSYLGYCLSIDGVIGGEQRAFSVGIGKATQYKHEFQVGDEVSGESLPVADVRQEPVAYYKTSKLKVLNRAGGQDKAPPPWHGIPEDLDTYRWRGHRRLSARTYERRCKSCIWGCRMPEVIIVDHW